MSSKSERLVMRCDVPSGPRVVIPATNIVAVAAVCGFVGPVRTAVVTTMPGIVSSVPFQ